MNYLNLLNLEKEPFSNSPDPDFFFASDQHMRSLQRLELAIRLRKGLCVALGEVGTGKTTLCRRLIRRLDSDNGNVVVHLLLDPEFNTPHDFLQTIADTLGTEAPQPADRSERELKEAIKQLLFHEGVDQGKIIVLIIDEGQKLPGFCLEILRELLNFETNQHKLLQIVIFAQPELREQLRDRENFSDRIAELCTLKPLNFKDTRRMILFRLREAHGRSTAPKLFSFGAMMTIYRMTGGYPRKIVQLCSQALLALIIQNKTRVTAALVRACDGRLAGRPRQPNKFLKPALLVLLTAAAISLWQWPPANHAVKMLMTQPGKTLSPARPVALQTKTPFLTPGPEASAPQEKTVQTAHNSIPDPQTPEPAAVIPATTAATNQEAPPTPKETTSSTDTADHIAILEKILNDPSLFPEKPQLGKLPITVGDSLSWMIYRIYGAFNQSLLEMVMAANPDIANIDRIPIGTVIVFPAASNPCRHPNQSGNRLLIKQANTLADADQVIKACRKKKLLVELVPAWQPKLGMTFLVLAIESYPDRQAATLAMQKLPSQLGADTEILSNWEENYIFFSNESIPQQL